MIELVIHQTLMFFKTYVGNIQFQVADVGPHDALKRDLAKALKLDADAVRCIHAEGSGCYGHNGADDVALDTALFARAVAARPVRLQWMRDDEFAWEPYGSAMLARAKAALDRKWPDRRLGL